MAGVPAETLHPRAGGMTPLARSIGAIAWPSFFTACVMTMVFFAFVDPLLLRDLTFPNLDIGREMGYSIGFLMFWVATASASMFTWLLLLPGSRFNRHKPTT